MRICFILATLLVSIICQSQMPHAHCASKPIYQVLPLTVGEVLSGDLSDAFTGYNLNITITKGMDIATVPQKLELMGQLKYPIQGLQSHWVQHKGNNWGDTISVVTDDMGQTNLHLYSFKNKKGAPELVQSYLVEYNTDTYCFEAAVFLDHGLAIVDCVKQGSGNSSNFLGIQNKFFYIDLVTGNVKKIVDNEMYESFSWISRRSFRRYHDPHTGYEYIVRAYLSNGVDAAHRNNTYLEFFSASDIEDLQIMRVVDRSFLSLPELFMTDFKIYLGDIFILDYLRGIYRLDITHGQQIVITGRYEAEFMTRFSVYSDDLDEQVLLALSNSHAVYEINMDRPNTPILLYKYSLMQHSQVHNLIIDEKFLVVQASANATNDDNTTTLLNYTWVFTKGSRTYQNAYKVIDHSSSDVLIDMNRYLEELLVFDRTGIQHYKLNDAKVVIQQKDNTTLNRSIDLVMTATSKDPRGKDSQVCAEKTVVHIVAPDNMTIWPSGITPPETYYMNYPGRVNIFLEPYAIGPNITYTVQAAPRQNLPRHWIDQQNQSNVHFTNSPPIIGEINFFHTEVVPHYGNETIIYYYQDIRNTTHVAFCTHLWEDVNINCNIQASYSHSGKIGKFTTSYFRDYLEYKYYYIWTLENAPNIIYVIDFIKHQRVATIELPQGYEGQVGSIKSSNGILYVVLPYMKTILAYHLNRCVDFTCPLSFTIDSKALKPLGIDYFSPTDMVTSYFHPEVLFIQCLGSVIILDVDNRDNLILLEELFSHAIVKNSYKLAVNRDYLIIVSAPNMIEEYSITDIYFKREVFYYKNLPLYNYTIPDDFDIEFSDFSNLFYINTFDPASNLTKVLIYRTGSFAVSSLYDVIDVHGLYSHKNLEIEVSGFFVDFVSIIASGSFSVYRQFDTPMLVMEDNMDDFKFYILSQNKETSSNISLVSVKVANYPEGFKPTSEFDKVKGKLRIEEKSRLSWDTRLWFKGHILRYNYSCPDCHDKIELVSHIHNTNVLRLGGADYIETFLGGLILAQDIFRLRLNGTVHEIILLPDPKEGERCHRAAATHDDLLTLTGCRVNGGGTHVYISSLAAHRGFTWGPYRTGAHEIANLQMVNNLVMIADVSEHPQFRLRNGGVFLYALDLNPMSENDMWELDYIDSNDFQGAAGWSGDDAYIGNSHLMYDGFDQNYRLYVTELNRGLFVIDFLHKMGEREINIITTNYIDLNKLLNDHGFHMPADATFLAVSHTGVKYNPVFQMENILVTTNGFHNFEITLIYDQKGHIITQILHRVYYRYGYYNTVNYVKTTDLGYMAINYIIPPVAAQISNYSRQLIALYDTKDYDKDAEKGFSERYMLGAHVFNHTDPCAFGFNSTYNPRTNGSTIGLVMIDGVSNRIWETSVSRNISFEFKGDAPAQTVHVKVYSDFDQYTFNIDVVPPKPDLVTEIWRIVLIVVGSIATAALLAYIVFLVYKRAKTDRMENPMEERLNDGSGDATGMVNESVAYDESVRNTLNIPGPESAPEGGYVPPRQEPAEATRVEPPRVVEAPAQPARVQRVAAEPAVRTEAVLIEPVPEPIVAPKDNVAAPAEIPVVQAPVIVVPAEPAVQAPAAVVDAPPNP